MVWWTSREFALAPFPHTNLHKMMAPATYPGQRRLSMLKYFEGECTLYNSNTLTLQLEYSNANGSTVQFSTNTINIGIDECLGNNSQICSSLWFNYSHYHSQLGHETCATIQSIGLVRTAYYEHITKERTFFPFTYTKHVRTCLFPDAPTTQRLNCIQFSLLLFRFVRQMKIQKFIWKCHMPKYVILVDSFSTQLRCHEILRSFNFFRLYHCIEWAQWSWWHLRWNMISNQQKLASFLQMKMEITSSSTQIHIPHTYKH